MDTLTPPAPVTLQAPAKVEPVEKEQAATMVPISDEDRARLEEQASAFVDKVTGAEHGSEELTKLVNAIHSMGNEDIQAVVNTSSRFMEQPTKMMHDAGDEGSAVASSLTQLRIKVNELDPSKRGPLTGARKLLGFIPFGNKLQAYFLEYQSAQGQIRSIIDSLRNSKDTLLQDNIEIENEKARLWALMGRLENLAYLAKVLDERLDTRLAEFEQQSPEKARIVREEVQFYLRQKRTDLLTQLAVAIQGYQVMDMGRKINLDLIKGVDRASNTTVYALSVAVKAAQMLANQKLVLEQINELNATTESVIAGTASMLKNNAAEMARQATSATVSIETLSQAFADINEAIDTVSNYKIEALEGMKTSADLLESEIAKAKTHTDQARAAVVTEFESGNNEATALLEG